MTPEVRFGEDGVVLVHDCRVRCGDGRVRTFLARSIPIDSRWKVVGETAETATVTDSIRCACGTHGHWTRGKWVPA